MNIIICGVGGQGILFISSIFAKVFSNQGKRVCFAKIFDEGQRNGSVSTHIRVDEGTSPLIPVGKADLLASLDKEETERNKPFLAKEDSLIEAYGKSNMFLLGTIIKKINASPNLFEAEIESKPNGEKNLKEFRDGLNA